MTVLAFDGRYVAVDSQITSGDTKYTARKAFEVETPDGQQLIVFGCGTWADVTTAVESLRSGLKLPRGDYTLIVWGFEGGLKEFAGCDGACPVDPSAAAWGSGGQAALGAILMGASAAKAVAIACQISLTCGGPVVVFDTKTGRFKPTKGT